MHGHFHQHFKTILTSALFDDLGSSRKSHIRCRTLSLLKTDARRGACDASRSNNASKCVIMRRFSSALAY